MAEVLTPVADDEVKAGAGSKIVITLGPSCQVGRGEQGTGPVKGPERSRPQAGRQPAGHLEVARPSAPRRCPVVPTVAWCRVQYSFFLLSFFHSFYWSGGLWHAGRVAGRTGGSVWCCWLRQQCSAASAPESVRPLLTVGCVAAGVV